MSFLDPSRQVIKKGKCGQIFLGNKAVKVTNHLSGKSLSVRLKSKIEIRYISKDHSCEKGFSVLANRLAQGRLTSNINLLAAKETKSHFKKFISNQLQVFETEIKCFFVPVSYTLTENK